MAVSVKQKIRFGPFELDVHSAELYKNDFKLKVQPQPIQVLSILLEHPGELVTRDELQRRIWPSDTFVDFEHGLNTAVKKLRQALGDESDTPKYIETLPRRGYRFVGQVEASNDADSGQPKRRYIWILGTSSLLALAVLIALGARNLFPTPPRIKDSEKLTNTQRQKVTTTLGFCAIVSDGSRVYFQEHREQDKWFISQVATAGGDISDISLTPWSRPCLSGMSPSNSELLVEECCPNKYWSIPLPAGPRRLMNLPNGARWATWMRDGRNILFSLNGDKDMFRVAVDGTTDATPLFSAPDITLPRVSPDGKRVRWTAMSGAASNLLTDIWEAGTDGKNPHPVFPSMSGQTFYGDWTSDGQLFFFFRKVEGHKSLWAVRERGRFSFFESKPVQIYAGPLQIESPVASKSAKELFVIGASLHGELSIYEARSKRYLPFLGGISACYVTFSPDAQWVAYVSYPDGSLWRSRLDGTERMQLSTSPTRVVNPRWSPDGKFIVFMDLSGTGSRAIYIVSPGGGQPRPLVSGGNDGGAAGDPTWSPDSQSIVYGLGHDSSPTRQVRLLDLRTMKSEMIPGSEGLWSPRWSPDGKYIVAADREWKLMVYSFATKSWRPLAEEGRMGWEAWSHDSKFVYAYDASKGTIVRFNIANPKLEVVASLDGVPWTNFGMRTGGWFDLTPDDRIMILHDRGTEEIYKLKLEY